MQTAKCYHLNLVLILQLWVPKIYNNIAILSKQWSFYLVEEYYKRKHNDKYTLLEPGHRYYGNLSYNISLVAV